MDGRVELPQRTLAAMLGVAQPSLNKVLTDLERDGLIRISYSTIEVPTGPSSPPGRDRHPAAVPVTGRGVRDDKR